MVDKCSSSDHCINAQAFFYVCLYIKASCKSTFIIFKSICDFVTYSSLNSFNILYKFIKMLFLLFFFFYTSRVSHRLWQIKVQPPFLTWYLTVQSMLQKCISSKWHSINVHIVYNFSLKYMLFLTGRNSIIFFQSCNYLQDCSDIIIVCWYFLNFIPINPVK